VKTKGQKAAPAGTVTIQSEEEHSEIDHAEPEQPVEHGHEYEQEGSATTTDTLVDDTDTITHEPEEHADVSAVLKEEPDEEPVYHNEPESVVIDAHENLSVAEPETSKEAEATSHAPDISVTPAAEEEAKEENFADISNVQNVPSQEETTDDLDDIVNMLEPKRLFTSATVVEPVHKELKVSEIAGEIPDEE